MSAGITRDEWLQALADVGFDAREHDEQAVTVMEFCGMIGLARTAAARRLKALVAAGKATEARKRTPEGVWCVAYRLNVEPTKPKRKSKAA